MPYDIVSLADGMERSTHVSRHAWTTLGDPPARVFSTSIRPYQKRIGPDALAPTPPELRHAGLPDYPIGRLPDRRRRGGHRSPTGQFLLRGRGADAGR